MRFRNHLGAARFVPFFIVCCHACSIGTAAEALAPERDELARHILADTHVRGGLIVHLGCGDGKLTASLRANDSYLVHGLDTNAGNVEAAREHIRKLDAYGKVSVDVFDGKHLPYADNLVNLLVAEDLGEVSMDEARRVLAPLGVARVGDNTIVKQWPKEIDEWTHFLHGADNNAVAEDAMVGPPWRLQWVNPPRWSRSHEHLGSLSAAVSAGGRLFYIIDKGPPASVAMPPQWTLIARDCSYSHRIQWLDSKIITQQALMEIKA